jgi:threonine dehydratase
LAIAAAVRGIPAYIVVPHNATRSKRAAIVANGAEIIDCEPTLSARETALNKVIERTGAHFVPPYDDKRIIAGQGTAALELLETQPSLDQVWVPIGGGGLAAGTAVVCSAASTHPRVIAAEPAAADDAYRSLLAGHIVPQTDPQTLADGLRTSVGELNFAILNALCVAVMLASEVAIVRAMRLLFEHLKVVVEPSAAVPLAALLDDGARARGSRIGLILTGGNLDLDTTIALLQRA